MAQRNRGESRLPVSNARILGTYLGVLVFVVAFWSVAFYVGARTELETRLQQTASAIAGRAQASSLELGSAAQEFAALPDVLGARIVEQGVTIASAGIVDTASKAWRDRAAFPANLGGVQVASGKRIVALYADMGAPVRQATVYAGQLAGLLLLGLPLIWLAMRRTSSIEESAAHLEIASVPQYLDSQAAEAKATPVAEPGEGAEPAIEEEPEPEDTCTDDSAEQLARLGSNLMGGAIYRLVFMPDGSRRFTYMSDGFEELFGIPARNVTEDPSAAYRLFFPEDLSEHMAREAESITSDSPFTSEVRMQSLKLSTVWVQFRAQPGKDSQGNPCLDGLMLDVTIHKDVEDQFREMATTDALTGLANRREFMQKADAELDRVRRYGSPMSVVMVDADHFKNVNDTYGHDAGDDVLRALAGTLKNTSRTVDVAGRLGGEEFALILPETDSKEAYAAAERLREAVEGLAIDTQDHILHITVSVGVATYSQEGQTVADLLKAADEALYEAKSTGRNKVVAV